MDKKKTATVGGFILGVVVVGAGIYFFVNQMTKKKVIISLNEELVPAPLVSILKNSNILPKEISIQEMLKAKKQSSPLAKYFKIRMV